MFVLTLISLVSSKICPIYQCSTPIQNISNAQCIEKNGFTYFLGTCSEEYYSYCPPNESDSFCQLPLTPSDINISYIGEPCVYDRNCYKSLCTDKICTGFTLNSTCSYTAQCNVGTYCFNSTCQALQSLNGVCKSDYDCMNNLGCYYSTCVQYFSLKEGEILESCEGGFNYLCASGACGIASNETMFCLGNYKSVNLTPAICSNDGDCLMNQTLVPEGYSSGCQCGYNEFGLSYCGLSPGDSDYQTFISLMKEWVAGSNIKKCHTYSRTNLKCINQFAKNSLAVELTYRYLLVTNYSQVQGNDECVKEIFTSQFWTAQSAYKNLPKEKDDDSMGAVLKVGILLLGLF